MIKPNRYLENLLVFQNSLSPAYCLFKNRDSVNWTEWVLQNYQVFKVAILCVGWGGMLVVGGVWVC